MDFQSLFMQLLSAQAQGHDIGLQDLPSEMLAGGRMPRRPTYQGDSVILEGEEYTNYLAAQVEQFWGTDLCNNIQQRMGSCLGGGASFKNPRGSGAPVAWDTVEELHQKVRVSSAGGGSQEAASVAAFGQGASAHQKIAMIKAMRKRLEVQRAEANYAAQIADVVSGNDAALKGKGKLDATTRDKELQGVWEKKRVAKELPQGSACFQGHPHRLPVKQKATVAHDSQRGVSVRFHPVTGDYVAWATGAGLHVFETNALLKETTRRQQFNTNTGVNFANVVPTVSSPPEDAEHVDVGWSYLDVTWIVPNADHAFAVASCWAPTLLMQRIDCQHSKTEDPYDIPQTILHLDGCGTGSGNFCCFGIDAMNHRTVVCGTNDACVFTYDVSAERQVWCSTDNAADVNTVCKLTPHVFASGEDNGIISIFDTRSPSSSDSSSVDSITAAGAAASYLLGHTNGLMSLSSRGDELHLVSNAKDQAIKVWDLRKAVNFNTAISASTLHRATGGATDLGDMKIREYVFEGTRTAQSRWDYRSGPHIGPPKRRTTKYDTSLRTFYGHEAYTTLSRARFSPLETTGGRYIISGSHNNGFAIYDLLSPSAPSGTQRRGRSGGELQPSNVGPFMVFGDHDNVVRDVAWHPTQPYIATSCWDGKLRLFGTDEADQFSAPPSA